MGINPNYVLDEMKVYEINSLMKYNYYSFKDGWEQARFIAYVVAQVNSTKHIEMNELLPFAWDESEKAFNNTELTQNEIEFLKKNAMKPKNKNIEKR